MYNRFWKEPRNEKTFMVHAVSWEIDWSEELRRSKASGSKSKCDWVSQPPRRLWYSIAFGLWPDWMWSWNQSLKEIGNLCVWRHGVVRSMESYASTRMRPVNHSPTRAARRAVIHSVESEYERFDCISDMHKFGVKVQQFMWTETSAEITACSAWYR